MWQGSSLRSRDEMRSHWSLIPATGLMELPREELRGGGRESVCSLGREEHDKRSHYKSLLLAESQSIHQACLQREPSCTHPECLFTLSRGARREGHQGEKKEWQPSEWRAWVTQRSCLPSVKEKQSEKGKTSICFRGHCQRDKSLHDSLSSLIKLFFSTQVGSIFI